MFDAIGTRKRDVSLLITHMVFLCFIDCVGKGIKSHWWGAKCRRGKNVIGV